MKNIKIIMIATFMLLSIKGSYAQALTNGTVNPSISGENPFFDASTYFDSSIDPSSSGKGLVFPRTDLTTWNFVTGLLDGINFPTAFDGMIVYNTATGMTIVGQGLPVSVTPGFYYFSNPTGNTTIIDGIWTKIGSGGSDGTAAIATKAANYTALSTDSTILCDNTIGAFTVTLPDPTTATGKVYVIRKIDSSANALTFSPSLINDIGGATVSSLNYAKTVRVQSNGTSWYIID